MNDGKPPKSSGMLTRVLNFKTQQPGMAVRFYFASWKPKLWRLMTFYELTVERTRHR
jgi:hypothetical protein